MIKPGQFGEYIGFTEKVVRNLCGEAGISFESMKKWYDGYECFCSHSRATGDTKS